MDWRAFLNALNYILDVNDFLSLIETFFPKKRKREKEMKVKRKIIKPAGIYSMDHNNNEVNIIFATLKIHASFYNAAAANVERVREVIGNILTNFITSPSHF